MVPVGLDTLLAMYLLVYVPLGGATGLATAYVLKRGLRSDAAHAPLDFLFGFFGFLAGDIVAVLSPTTIWRQHILDGGTVKRGIELEPYRLVCAFVGSILTVVLFRVALRGILGAKKGRKG